MIRFTLPLLSALVVTLGASCSACTGPIDAGEGEGEGEGDVAAEGEGDAGEGEGDAGEGEGDAGEGEGEGEDPNTVVISIIDISDWHGQLDPLTVKNPPTSGATCTVDADCGAGEACSNGACNATVGGASILAAYFDDERAAHPNNVTVTAGDSFGGTPPLSSAGAVPDEPAVKALRMMGIELDTFGNHNFDRGMDALQGLIDLAESATSVDAPGAPYQFVSSNLTHVSDELTGVDTPFVMKQVAGVNVAFIGITNDDAADLVFPGRLNTIVIDDSAAAASAAQTAARDAGADVVVALVHMGVVGFSDPPGNTQPLGPIVDFANAVSGFDAIIADHTDVKFNGVINGQRVVENKSKGATYSRVDIAFNTVTAAVTSASAVIIQPKLTPDITPVAAIDDMLGPYRNDLAAVFDEDIGDTTDLFPRDGTIERLGEAAIGDIVADAVRLQNNTTIAFVNGGGLRASIPSSYAPVATGLRRPPAQASGPWDVLVGDVFAVLPFGNTTATFSITPQTLYQAMAHGLDALPNKDGHFPQISGFTVVFDVAQTGADRVVSITLDGEGQPLSKTDNTRQISAATSDFVVLGGDGYSMLAGLPYTLKNIMAEDFLAHLRSLSASALVPATHGRIVQANASTPVSVTSAGATTATLGINNSGVFTVTLDTAAPNAGTSVALTVSPAGALDVPSPILVPAGKTSTTFRAFSGGTASNGPITVTATTAAGAGHIDVTVAQAGAAPAAGDLVINEIMFDVPATNGDFNCDGVVDEEDDEFVEFVNVTNHTIDLTGAALWDATRLAAGTAPNFTVGTFLIGPGEPFLVLGSALGTDTTAPWCALADQVEVVGDAEVLFPAGVNAGVLNLNNTGGDSITLTSTNVASSTVLVSASYAADATANIAQVRSPDITGAFTAYSSADGHDASLAASPGLLVNLDPFAAN